MDLIIFKKLLFEGFYLDQVVLVLKLICIFFGGVVFEVCVVCFILYQKLLYIYQNCLCKYLNYDFKCGVYKIEI